MCDWKRVGLVEIRGKYSNLEGREGKDSRWLKAAAREHAGHPLKICSCCKGSSSPSKCNFASEDVVGTILEEFHPRPYSHGSLALA